MELYVADPTNHHLYKQIVNNIIYIIFYYKKIISTGRSAAAESGYRCSDNISSMA
jgi:hypothetical protein